MNPEYLNAINLSFGPSRSKKLLKFFGSARKAWQAPFSRLQELGIKTESLEKIFAIKNNLDPKQELEKLKERKIETITIEDPRYPDILKEIAYPPLMLYAKGDTSLLQTPSLAVVGTRAMSSYARAVLPKIVGELCFAGLTIVSGLAQGIDALAHQETLRHNGKAVAVMGCGLGQIFPRLNLALAKNIISNGGLIISEYPLGAPPLKQHFPARNRIIAGLSVGILVVESRERGGSLITAEHALDSSREIFAIPGPINLPSSQGTNTLIQKGAKLVTCATDIIDELSVSLKKQDSENIIAMLSQEEQIIVSILETEPLHVDIITKQAKLTSSQINSLLTSLELKGAAKNTGGNIWNRVV